MRAYVRARVCVWYVSICLVCVRACARVRVCVILKRGHAVADPVGFQGVPFLPPDFKYHMKMK